MHSLALWLLPSPAIHLLGGRCLLALLSLRQRIEQQALPDGLLLNAQKKSNPCLPCFACTPVHDSKAANTLCPRANTPLDRKNSDPFVLLVSCRPRSTLRATGGATDLVERLVDMGADIEFRGEDDSTGPRSLESPLQGPFQGFMVYCLGFRGRSPLQGPRSQQC